MPDFPTNPYKGQIFYDPESETVFEYFVPREDDYLCKKLKIKAKWVKLLKNLWKVNYENYRITKTTRYLQRSGDSQIL